MSEIWLLLPVGNRFGDLVRESGLGVSGMLRCWDHTVTVRTNSCQKCYQIICNLQKLIFQNASRLQVHRCVKRTLTIRSVRKWHMCSSGFVIRARRKRCQKFKCANALTRNGGVGVEEIPPSNPSGGAMYIATKYDPKTTLEWSPPTQQIISPPTASRPSSGIETV